MDRFTKFLYDARSPFQAVYEVAEFLKNSGFYRNVESQVMDFSRPGFCIRDGSALLAWIPGTDPRAGFVSIQSHTDSPSLRLLYEGVIRQHGSVFALPVENYSSIGIGRLLDRKLCVGGRIAFSSPTGVSCVLVSSSEFFFIPSLATHMLRNPGDPKEWVPEGDELCVCTGPSVTLNGHTCELHDGMKISDMLKQLFDAEANKLDIAAHQIEFTAAEQNQYGSILQSARLDNLASVYASEEAMINSLKKVPVQRETRVMFAYNHEEIGSLTRSGAHGPALRDFWARYCSAAGLSREEEIASFHCSLHISADGAHGKHPVKGASSCQDPIPVIGGGFCFKLSQRQNYAFSDYLIGIGKVLATQAGAAHYIWAAKTFKAGGGTIGNIVAADADARVIDCGIPMLGMHSCCETIDRRDLDAFQAFFEQALTQGCRLLKETLSAMNE